MDENKIICFWKNDFEKLELITDQTASGLNCPLWALLDKIECAMLASVYAGDDQAKLRLLSSFGERTDSL